MTISDIKNRFRFRKYLLLALLLISASLGYATIINKHAIGKAQYHSDNSREIPKLPDSASVLWNLADTSAYLNVNDDSNFGDTSLPILGIDALENLLIDDITFSSNGGNPFHIELITESPAVEFFPGRDSVRFGAGPKILFLSSAPGSGTGNNGAPPPKNPENDDTETDTTTNMPDRQPTANETTNTVPEPITLILMGLGLAVIAFTRRQKRS